MHKMMFVFFMLFISLKVCSQPLRFSTWEPFEADKLSSIWLIKRFIDSNAVITVYPHGYEIPNVEISFDTQTAKFKRVFNQCTFEQLVQYYGIKDRKVRSIGMIIHDIEINNWGRKQFEETRKIEGKITSFITNIKGKDEIIKKSRIYFDALLADMPESNQF